jgi:hypothetical protein
LPLATAVIAVVLVLGLAEGGVRLLLDPMPAPHEGGRFRNSPTIFARTILQAKVQVVKLGDHEIRINSLGYRGPEFAAVKPPGVTRIIIYGGSTVFDPANGVDWPHRVQEGLRAAGFTGVEVINAGAYALASFDSLGRLLAEGHRFSPDYVLFTAGWNDIKFFGETRSLLRAAKPWGENIDPRTTYDGAIDEFLSRNSQAYVRLRAAVLDWWLDAGPEGQKPEAERSSEIRPEWLRQFRITVDTFIDLVRNIRAVPVLLTEARLAAPGIGPDQEKRILYDYVALTPEGLLKAYAAVDREMHEAAAEKHVAVIDASAVMSGKDAFFVDHSHLTESGSIEMGRIVTNALIPLLSVAPTN